MYPLNSSINKIASYSMGNCVELRVIGCFCLIVFFLSFFSNSILLWIFYKNKNLRNVYNIFLISLTIVNLMATIFEFPVVCINAFNCG